jgi:hypothetical protein
MSEVWLLYLTYRDDWPYEGGEVLDSIYQRRENAEKALEKKLEGLFPNYITAYRLECEKIKDYETENIESL